MQNELLVIHHQVSSLSKSRLPELSMTVQSLSHLLKIFGEKYIELSMMHATYKQQSQEYMQILLVEIRKRSRQLQNKSRSDDSSFFDKDDLHRISYDDASSSGAFIEWSDILSMLDQAFVNQSSVKQGCQVLETLNYQINFERLRNQKQSIQLIEWLQIAHRFKDQEVRELYEFVASGKRDKVENTFSNTVLLIKNEFLNMCEMQKGYIRSIEELNHQVKELISEITTRQIRNDTQQKEKTTQDLTKLQRDEQFQPTTKHIQFVIHDYERMKTETQKLKQLLKSTTTTDFLPIERQLARHINISNILQTQLNRVIRQFNIYEDSFWEIYELPQVENLQHVVQHLLNINQRMEHMTGKVNRIFKWHIDVKRNKNQLKIGYVMQEIQELLKTQEPDLKGIQHVCIEVKNLTDGLLRDEGLGKGLLRIILGLDNLFSLLPIKDADMLEMIEEQKQRLLRLVGGLAGANRNEKSEDKTTIVTEYQKEICELKKQNQWLVSRNQKLLQQNEGLKSALQQMKKLDMGTENQNHMVVCSLENRIRELNYEKMGIEQQLKQERAKFQREKNNLHLQVKKTSVKLERLEKLALRKMDINLQKPPVNVKKGKVIINSHL